MAKTRKSAIQLLFQTKLVFDEEEEEEVWKKKSKKYGVCADDCYCCCCVFFLLFVGRRCKSFQLLGIYTVHLVCLCVGAESARSIVAICDNMRVQEFFSPFLNFIALSSSRVKLLTICPIKRFTHSKYWTSKSDSKCLDSFERDGEKKKIDRKLWINAIECA